MVIQGKRCEEWREERDLRGRERNRER